VGKDVLSKTFKMRQSFVCLRVNGNVVDPWGESEEFLNCVARGCEKCRPT
jgi:hypothetical protein